MKKPIYLDNAATTATRPEVVQAMLPYFGEFYGNPSTIYSLGTSSKQAEEQALLSINDKKAIIATGGSAVFSAAGMAHLKENGICVYLRVDEQELIRRLTNIKTRGIACRPGETVAEIIAEREVYYNRYADITIDCLNTTAEQVVGMIMDRIK